MKDDEEPIRRTKKAILNRSIPIDFDTGHSRRHCEAWRTSLDAVLTSVILSSGCALAMPHGILYELAAIRPKTR